MVGTPTGAATVPASFSVDPELEGSGVDNATKDVDTKIPVAVMEYKKGGAMGPAHSSDSFSYNVFQVSCWRRFVLLARPFWARPLRGKNGSFADGSGVAWALLAALVALIFGTTGLLVKLNFQQGEFFTALSKKEADRFWEAVALYLAIIVVAIPVLAVKEYVLNKLGLVWRAWMTEHLLKLYFCHNKAYFRLSSQTSPEHQGWGGTPQDEKGLLQTIDNPDQRIVADVESFVQAALNFSVVFLGAGLRVASFGAILYNISASLAVFLIIYSVAMTGAVTWLFGKRLAVLNFIARKYEADLRFNLVRS